MNSLTMHPIFLFPATLLLLICTQPVSAEWSGWRGGARSGSVSEVPDLIDSLPEEMKPLWVSEPIPSDHDGGHGSPVVSRGRVYLSTVWVEHEPSETRTIDQRVISQLGIRSTSQLDPGVVEAMESARLQRNARLRGDALKSWAKDWVEEHLDERQRLALGDWVAGRLVKGASVLSVEDMRKIQKVQDREFPDHEALVAWMDEAGFGDPAREQILKAVPGTRAVAEDSVICLDAESGRTRWRARIGDGIAKHARKASSTPVVAGGRVYAVGSAGLAAIEVETGKPAWVTALEAKTGAVASSPLVADGKVIILSGRATAYDAATGKQVWECADVQGNTASPVLWEIDGRAVLVASGKKSLAGIDLQSGDLLWEIEGGGPSTPAVSGNHLVALTGQGKENLCGFKATEDGQGIELAWSHGWTSRRYHSSPVIHDGHAYLFGCDRHLCVDLQSGDQKWLEVRSVNITSPVLADGKFFLLENRGSFLTMIDSNPTAHEVLGRTKVFGLQCPTPAIDPAGRLIVRTKDHLAAYDLRATGE